MPSPDLQYTPVCRENVPLPQWLERFPALKNSLRISADQGNIELPYYSSDSLYKDHVILPLDNYERGVIPAWLNNDMPVHFYSALVLFGDRGLVTFDTDFTGCDHFVQNVQCSIDTQKHLQNMRWGIKVLLSKLPHPIAASREVCFHLGHDDMPLPLYVGAAITNACNLRCTICGSQAHLDTHKIPRGFMQREIFEKIARTLFPSARTVEVNSLGEPTFHKDFAYFIELISKYDCEIYLQTNATNLTDDVLRALGGARGSVSLSIDATGAIFERQRVNAVWAGVDENVRKLMAIRDRSKLEITLYPTLTRRTLPDAARLCQWAESIGIDRIGFHYYVPISGGIEECPTDGEKTVLEKNLLRYIAQNAPNCEISLQFAVLRSQALPARVARGVKKWRTDLVRETKAYMKNLLGSAVIRAVRKRQQWLAAIKKAAHAKICGTPPTNPLDKFHPYSRFYYYNPNLPDLNPKGERTHPRYVCAAPLSNVVLNLAGDFSVCSKTQTTVFGSATSDESFYAAWLGDTMAAVRKSFLRENLKADCLPECKGCIAMYNQEGKK